MANGTGSGSEGGDGRGGKRGIFDDLAGMAGGAFSVMTAVRSEAEAMAKAQVEAMVQRLELVRREEFDAALEVARRAREQSEALAERVAALEARMAAGGGAAQVDGGAAGAPDDGSRSSPQASA